MATVTLRNRSRSNGWYGTKVLVRIIIWHIEKDLVRKTFKLQANLVPIGIHWKSEL